MKYVKPQKVHQDFIRLRHRLLKEAREEKKAELIRQGYPADALEIPRPEKKSEE